MSKWIVYWILTVQTYDGEVRTNYPMTMYVDNQTLCIIEMKGKHEQLELMLDKEYYIHDSGVRTKLGGKLIGFTVGCENRAEKYKLQVPSSTIK